PRAGELVRQADDVASDRRLRAPPPQHGNREQAVRSEVVALCGAEHERLELVVGHAFSSLQWRGDHPGAQEGSHAHEAWTGEKAQRFAWPRVISNKEATSWVPSEGDSVSFAEVASAGRSARVYPRSAR